MLSAQTAIHRYRRDVALGLVVRSLLLAAGVASVLVLPFVVRGFDASFGLAIVFGVWLVLSFTSAKSSRLLAPSPELIATGQFEEAERLIDQSMRAFSMSRTSKLLGLHHLAVLRHKQRRWQEAVALARAVLGQRLGRLAGAGPFDPADPGRRAAGAGRRPRRGRRDLARCQAVQLPLRRVARAAPVRARRDVADGRVGRDARRPARQGAARRADAAARGRAACRRASPWPRRSAGWTIGPIGSAGAWNCSPTSVN